MSDNKSVPIRLFVSGKPEYAARDTQDETRVAEIIRAEVLSKSDAEYHRVDVKIRRTRNVEPTHLIAYLLRKDIYFAEIVKIDVNADFEATGTSWNYDDSAEPEEDEGEAEFFVPPEDYAAYDIIAATPVPEIATAKAAVEAVCSEATRAGLKCKVLLGADANVANYKFYLTSGLQAFVNVGHGNTSGIMLADGTLPWTWFDSVAGQAVKPTVIYWNSCQVHNDPLKSAVMKSGARTYIGGIVNLLIGASEKVCVCFWTKVLHNPTPMKDALEECERANYPAQGAHGICGDLGPFNVVNICLAQAMWVHGHAMTVENPERLDLEKRYGFFIQVRGKPFTTNWFHFAVPTPVIAGGRRHCVGSVMIRFRTGPGAAISAVHVYDGEVKIAAHDGLSLASPGGFIWRRFDVPSHPDILWGLGISLGVKFGDSANLPANKLLIELSSAGCDFALRV